MNPTLKKTLNFTFAIIIIAILLYYTAKDIDFKKLWDILLHLNYWWMLVSIPVILISHYLRAFRWNTMLKASITDQKFSIWRMFSAVMIGYAVNCVIPRGGEFVRPYAFSRHAKISYTTTFATIIVERFLDLISLILLFCCVFFFFREQIILALPQIHPEKIIIPTILALIVLLLSFYPPFIKFVLKFIIKPISNKLYLKISDLFDKFILGFKIIKSPSKYIRIIIESFSIWLFYTIPLYLMFFCFPESSFGKLGFDDAILLIVISGIGVTIGLTPGAIGVYHYLISNTLIQIYKIAPEEAFAYATLTHTINYIIQIGVGGLFMFIENIKKIPMSEKELEENKGLMEA